MSFHTKSDDFGARVVTSFGISLFIHTVLLATLVGAFRSPEIVDWVQSFGDDQVSTVTNPENRGVLQVASPDRDFESGNTSPEASKNIQAKTSPLSPTKAEKLPLKSYEKSDANTLAQESELNSMRKAKEKAEEKAKEKVEEARRALERARAQKQLEEGPLKEAKQVTANSQREESGRGSSGQGNDSDQPFSGFPDETEIREARLRALPGNPVPNYPRSDRLAEREGWVSLVAEVSQNGKIRQIFLESHDASQEMIQSSMEALKDWRFEPGYPGFIRQGIQFSLSGRPEVITK